MSEKDPGAPDPGGAGDASEPGDRPAGGSGSGADGGGGRGRGRSAGRGPDSGAPRGGPRGGRRDGPGGRGRDGRRGTGGHEDSRRGDTRRGDGRRGDDARGDGTRGGGRPGGERRGGRDAGPGGAPGRGGPGGRGGAAGRRDSEPGSGRAGRGGGQRLAPTGPRLPEPRIDEGVTGKELDRSVRQQLRTLSKENAEGVAQHLVMVGNLLAVEDLDGALAHAETVVRRAGRVPAAREALGLVAYRMGDYARALGEFRTVRRLSGSSHLLPLMVDCERGLGRAERALELASSPEAAGLDRAERVELTIVVSGIRRDLGQLDAAVVALQVPELTGPPRPWTPRLAYAYADALLARGDVEQARDWFARAAAADTDLETDAAERLDEIDGVELTELADDPDEAGDPGRAGGASPAGDPREAGDQDEAAAPGRADHPTGTPPSEAAPATADDAPEEGPRP